MKRLLLFGGGTTAFLVLIIFAGLMSNATAAGVTARPLDTHTGFLAPYLDVRLPETATGPVPAALMFHGCGGVRQVQDDYALALNEAGYAAVIVDSNAARGIGRMGAMTQVCGGFRLWGQERAADVFAAVAEVRTLDAIDPDRLTLIGWSHGGWTILDALGFEAEASPVPALDHETGSLDGVENAIIFYPWCGWPSRTDRTGLHTLRPLQIILSGNDLVARTEPCETAARAAISNGQPVTLDSWDGLSHAFDEPNSPILDPRMQYDAEASARARALVVEVMGGQGE